MLWQRFQTTIDTINNASPAMALRWLYQRHQDNDIFNSFQQVGLSLTSQMPGAVEKTYVGQIHSQRGLDNKDRVGEHRWHISLALGSFTGIAVTP
jgi:hypothetical protein